MRRLLVLLGLVSILVGCGEATPTPTALASYGLADLVRDLQARGAVVTQSPQQVNYGFLTTGKRLELDGVPVFVFEFADPATVEWVAGGISADAGSITITRLEDGSRVWSHGDCIGTPYLYKKGRLIVILYDDPQAYDSAPARRMIRSLLGPHFAGGPWAFISNR